MVQAGWMGVAPPDFQIFIVFTIGTNENNLEFFIGIRVYKAAKHRKSYQIIK